MHEKEWKECRTLQETCKKIARKIQKSVNMIGAALFLEVPRAHIRLVSEGPLWEASAAKVDQ